MGRVSFREYLQRERGGSAEDIALSARPRRGPIPALALCGGILVIAIAVATAMAVYASRDRAVSAAKRELENSALLVSRHFEQVLTDFIFVQKAIAAEIELEQIDTPEEFREKMGTHFIHRMLASKVTAARELVGVTLWTAEGQLLNASQQWPVANRSVAQREYFKTFKSNRTDKPYLIELVSSQFVDGRAIVFAHKINSSQGEFIGLLTRALSPKVFENYFASVALGKDAAITLLHTDGTMIARYPQADHLIGKNILSTIQYERLGGTT